MSTRRNFQSSSQQKNVSSSVNSSQTTNNIDDEIINLSGVTGQAQDFYSKNQKNILIALAGLIMLIGGYLAYKYLWIVPKETEAIEAMYQAEAQFAQDSFAAALKNPGANFEGFEAIAENYSGTKTGNTAKLYAGICNLNLGQFEEAISYLEDYSASDDITPAIKYGALGDAYAESNQMDKAYSNYESAANSSDDEFTAPFYMNKLGLLQFAQKKNAEALKTFKTISEKYPNTQEGKEAEKMVARLSGE
jgi:predicted negative regulator of RcsB-dependent stress response